MKRIKILLVLFAGLLLFAGTSCTQTAGNGCLHIDGNIGVIDEHQGPSVCALCEPGDDLHNQIENKFAWTQID